MQDITTPTSLFARHQQLLVRRLEREHGLRVQIRDDMLELVRTYSALTETGYVQLPFMLDKPVGVPSPHFWVSISDGPDIIAMAGLRVITNGEQAQSVADFFGEGGLYPAQGSRREDYIPGAGPWLEAGARFGYLGAGWVHGRWRGHAIAGLLGRIVNAEAAIRSPELDFVSCMTFQPMFGAGLNQRANCWHHMHAELVLDGYLAALDREVLQYFSHSTLAEQAQLYAREVKFLELGLVVPWLRPHDTTPAPALIEAAPVAAIA